MKKKDQVTAAEEQKEAVQVKGKKRRAREAQREIRWDRLDNTAHLFPVIAGESMSNVYRISAVSYTHLDVYKRQGELHVPDLSGVNQAGQPDYQHQQIHCLHEPYRDCA